MELINPFTRNIAHAWGRIFEADLFGEFKDSTIKNIVQLAREVEESAAPGLKDRVRKQSALCVEEARVALDRVVQMVGETLTTEQKEISRSLSPHVQAEMVDGYDQAMLETGLGSVARQRVCWFYLCCALHRAENLPGVYAKLCQCSQRRNF